MSVVNMAVGATTPDGATFVAKVDGGGPVRVAVSTDESMASPVFTSSQAVDAQGVAKASIAGLDPATRHWWQVEDNAVIDTSVTGQFLTLPTVGQAASFTIGVGHCAGATSLYPGVAGGELAADRVSNHPVFDTIRQAALAGDWLGFAHLGDLHYYDLGSGSHGIAGGGSLANYRSGYDDVLAQPNQAALYRQVAWWSMWDDHDYGPDNSDGTLATKANALQVYGERVPHHALDGSNGIYQSWQIGRVLFITSDTRFLRSPNSDPEGPSKTMLGAAQKTWLDALLDSSTAEVLVWLMPSQWLGTSGDTWGNFTTERDELAAMLADHGFADRMVMCYGDRHSAGIDSGGSNDWGGFPVMLAGSLDSAVGTPQAGVWDVLEDTPARGQYGTVEVTDTGAVISVRLSAWRGTTRIGSYQVGFSITGTPVAGGALLRSLTGSQVPLFEARVVSGHPTGDDPDGTDIKVLGGDVVYDGTAEIQGTLQLRTLGLDEDTYESTFPRLTGDLLAPYGNEIFIRYGLDLGGAGILWTPLGYYRINDPNQAQAPYGEINIKASDRMAGIIDSTLLEPRSYRSSRTLASVVQELVEDIYPGAVIVWDDSSGQTRLGRTLVAEESRYEVIKDIVDSVGKIAYWDGEGLLRIEDAPDEAIPVWEVRAGNPGVLVEAGRSLTRRGVHNAVIFTGEAADEDAGVRAIAIDANPVSPTYFYGPFGQVPRRHESTLVSTQDAANAAAIAMLRRSLGAPYQVEFRAVTNPTLRPWHPVRVTYRDGTREIHVMQQVRIPLTKQPMTGTTRTRILATIGSLS